MNLNILIVSQSGRHLLVHVAVPVVIYTEKKEREKLSSYTLNVGKCHENYDIGFAKLFAPDWNFLQLTGPRVIIY